MLSEKWDLRYLRLAKEVSMWSRDPSTKTGAVIVAQDGSPVSFGFNGFARGVDDLEERYNNRELKYKLVIHCEENAVLFADRDRLKEATLYTWPFMSCSRCAARMIQAGITRIVAPSNIPSRWLEECELAKTQFAEAGVEMQFYDISTDKSLGFRSPNAS